MALIIVLSILILVIGTVFVFMYLWWKSFGKHLFKMVKDLQNLQNNAPGMPKLPNMGDLQQQMRAFSDIVKKMNKK